MSPRAQGLGSSLRVLELSPKNDKRLQESCPMLPLPVPCTGVFPRMLMQLEFWGSQWHRVPLRPRRSPAHGLTSSSVFVKIGIASFSLNGTSKVYKLQAPQNLHLLRVSLGLLFISPARLFPPRSGPGGFSASHTTKPLLWDGLTEAQSTNESRTDVH